jgi:alginate O-acetyltransferase complex protein AlgI
MLFNSFIFFIFLGIVLPIFYALRSKKSKNIFLLVASYVFYGYWDWRFCFLLTLTTVVDYYMGHQIFSASDPKKKKIFLITSLVFNLGILGFFKYCNFFISSFQDLCAVFGSNVDFLHLNILLPVGLSFYVFHNISYIIDVYRKEIEPVSDIVDFGLFVVFFPQLVAGPIGKATIMIPQLTKKLQPNKAQIKSAIALIIMGLFRKVMIGDTSGRFVDHVFGDLETYKSFELICALVLFSVQIYADFSGYSLIAMGTAKLFGVELQDNFKQPYLSRNITEFWRRWHISLSSWLRDYLYISLGGNRKSKLRTYLNLFITMLLGGLWHGASWNFVIWGGLHGVYLAIHKLMLSNQQHPSGKIEHFNFRNVLQILFTYFLVLFTWLFFRSTSWESTSLFFSKIFHWENSEYTLWFIKMTATFVFFTLVMDLFEYKSGQYDFILSIKSKPLLYGLLTGLLVLTLCFMFQTKPAPFIYFKF